MPSEPLSEQERAVLVRTRHEAVRNCIHTADGFRECRVLAEHFAPAVARIRDEAVAAAVSETREQVAQEIEALGEERVDHLNLDVVQTISRAATIARAGATPTASRSRLWRAVGEANNSKREPLRVLIACEYSGTVRDAFRALGHDAMSCDLLPTDVPGPHYQGDVFDVIGEGWDLLIAHPPCTFLAKSGLRWLHDYDRYPDRWADMVDGAVFFRSLLNAPVPRVAVENPRMHRHATKIIGEGPTQVIEPWMHGHPETKATGLWLRNLPPLAETNNVRASLLALPKSERSRIHWTPPGRDRWKVRSTTYVGIAQAMAEQWGGPVRATSLAPCPDGDS